MGERFLGRLVSAGTSINNVTTATPFSILPGQKLTVYPSAAGRVATDFETCTNTPAVPSSTSAYGLPVPASAPFPTAAGMGKVVMPNTTATSAVISFLPDSGAANLDVFTRSGDE